MVVSLWSQDGSGANHVSQEKEDDSPFRPELQDFCFMKVGKGG